VTDGREQSPVRRPVVVTAFLLVAVAVLLVALRSWLDRPTTDDAFVADALIAVPQDAQASNTEAALDDGPTADMVSADAEPEISVQSSAQQEPLKVVLLPARVDNSNAEAVFLADAIRAATLGSLRGRADVEVADVGAAELAAVVLARADPPRAGILVLHDVSRRYGNATVAEIEVNASNAGLCWAVSLEVVRSGGVGSVRRMMRIRRNGNPGPGNDPESIGSQYAGLIAVDTRARDAESAVRTDARRVLIDATRSDDERTLALTTLGNQLLDPPSVTAAVELAARSASPETRKQIWSMLRRANDASLAAPMRIALQSDPDAAVRLEAALGLRRYLDEAGIRTAVAQAALGDTSADVRLAARMAMMDPGEERDFKLATLFDRSLTPSERVAPMNMGPNPIITGSPDDVGGELAALTLAYAEIISGTVDPEVKLSALSALQGMVLAPTLIGSQRQEPDPALVRVLIETAASADERLQRAALYAMRPYADHPEIRTVLASVLEANRQLAYQLNIPGALTRAQESNSGAPPPPC